MQRVILRQNIALGSLIECYISCAARALSGIENYQLEVHTRHMKQLETHGVVIISRIGICAYISHFVSLLCLLNN